MLRRLLPPSVAVCVAEPWMWSTAVHAREEALVARAVEKRRREFRAGRHCARAALARLGVFGWTLARGPQGEPVWPDAVCGAISHCQGYCAAAVASTTDCLGLGIDVELRDAVRPGLLAHICTTREQRRLDVLARAHPGLPLATISFSAKESIHKLYFPLNRHVLDFGDVELTLDVAGGSFAADIVAPAPSARHDLRALRGRFAVDADHVYTTVQSVCRS
jgi:4'-phosphopantetheinyl transferase EntD